MLKSKQPPKQLRQLQTELFQKFPKSHFLKNHEHLSLEESSGRSMEVRGRDILGQANAMRHGEFLMVMERRGKSLGNQ